MHLCYGRVLLITGCLFIVDLRCKGVAGLKTWFGALSRVCVLGALVWVSACTVGWSDLALFCNVRIVTRFCWSGIFLGGQFQKIVKFRRARAKAFIFKKSQGPKYEYCFVQITESFLIHQKTIANKKIGNLKFFFIPKMADTVFDQKNSF